MASLEVVVVTSFFLRMISIGTKFTDNVCNLEESNKISIKVLNALQLKSYQ
jgi:hypothetical protein